MGSDECVGRGDEALWTLSNVPHCCDETGVEVGLRWGGTAGVEVVTAERGQSVGQGDEALWTVSNVPHCCDETGV